MISCTRLDAANRPEVHSCYVIKCESVGEKNPEKEPTLFDFLFEKKSVDQSGLRYVHVPLHTIS